MGLTFNDIGLLDFSGWHVLAGTGEQCMIVPTVAQPYHPTTGADSHLAREPVHKLHEDPRFVVYVCRSRKTGRHHRSISNVTGPPGCRTREINAGSCASYLARTPCFALCSIGGGNERALRLPGGGDHFHYAVEPLPGQYSISKKGSL